MADTPFIPWGFAATNGLVTRTLPDRLFDVVNVLEYGADPTYTSDSTAAIQAAFDAAFGTAASPHGFTNAHLNKAVFIPNGHYAIWSGPLVLTQVSGGLIFGSGRMSTVLDAGNSAGSNDSVLRTNGMSNTRIESLRLTTGWGWQGHTGICLDLNWDGTNTAADTSAGVSVGLHSNHFLDLLTNGGGFGVKIAASGNDGASNVFTACHINGAIKGIATLGAAAVNQSVYGGNIGDCITGISAALGGFSHLAGISLQAQNVSGTEIRLESTSVGPTKITGCRGEGDFFLISRTTSPVVVTGCNHAGFGSAPIFVEAYGPIVIEGCYSVKGKISVREGAQVILQYTYFSLLVGVANWLDAPASGLWWVGDAGGHVYGATIEIENVTSGDPMTTGNLVVKNRMYTTNGTTLTTKSYSVV